MQTAYGDSITGRGAGLAQPERKESNVIQLTIFQDHFGEDNGVIEEFLMKMLKNQCLRMEA